MMHVHLNPVEAGIAAAALQYSLAAGVTDDVSAEVLEQIRVFVTDRHAPIGTILQHMHNTPDEWREMMGAALLSYMRKEPYDEDESIICSEIITQLEVSGVNGKILRAEDDPAPENIPVIHTITVQHQITEAAICNLFVGAFEGGSTYWMIEANYAGKVKPQDEGVVWWGSDNIYGDQDFKAVVKYWANPDDDKSRVFTKTIVMEDIIRALRVMAEKEFRHFADVMGENDDNITHDVFMQLVVMGEVIYG